MEKITIDFKNVFDCSQRIKTKQSRSGYVRVVQFLDGKMHFRPQVYEGDKMSELDKAILDVEKGNVKNFDALENMMAYLEAW